MSECTVAVSIAATRETVFGLITDLEGIPDIIQQIVKMERLTDGPFGVGTRFRETRVMFGKEASELMEVTKFDPPSGYLLEAESHGAHYFTDHRFEDRGSETVVTITFRAKTLTKMAKLMHVLMGPLMKKSIEKCIRQDLEDIKRVAESSAASTLESQA